MDRLAAEAAFRGAMIDAGHLLPLPRRGLWGFTGDFEAVLEGFESLVRSSEPTRDVQVRSFPPLLAEEVFVATGYVRSFPQLIGSVNVFLGDGRGHQRLLKDQAAGLDWTTHLEPAHLNMLSAPCHATYPMHAGQILPQRVLYELTSRCFRHEPSDDPARLMSFRMREKVCIGTPDDALEHRQLGLEVGPELLRSVGLTISVDPANDPFFGRAANLLKEGQRDAELKFEFVCPMYGGDNPGVALGSSNYHLDHFGLDFDIRTGDGQLAHSSCIGYGLERVTLALFATHGTDVSQWPSDVRQRLGLG